MVLTSAHSHLSVPQGMLCPRCQGWPIALYFSIIETMASTGNLVNVPSGEVGDQIWLVSFLEYDLGYFDKESDRVEPGPSPFIPDKVLTM